MEPLWIALAWIGLGFLLCGLAVAAVCIALVVKGIDIICDYLKRGNG